MLPFQRCSGISSRQTRPSAPYRPSVTKLGFLRHRGTGLLRLHCEDQRVLPRSQASAAQAVSYTQHHEGVSPAASSSWAESCARLLLPGSMQQATAYQASASNPPLAAALQWSSPTKPGSLFMSWLALGVLLTLAAQRCLHWLGQLPWVQPLKAALAEDPELPLPAAYPSSPPLPSSPAYHSSPAGSAQQAGSSAQQEVAGTSALSATQLQHLAPAATVGLAPPVLLPREGQGQWTSPGAAGRGEAKPGQPASNGAGQKAAAVTGPPGSPGALPVAAEEGESVEWLNMCLRKAWRVYQRGLERWIIDLLQPVFDGLVKDGSVPRFVQRLRVVELTLDHEAPCFSNMKRRHSRKDSDLHGVVDLRYTGGVRMLLMLEVGEGRWRLKVPVLVSELDLECSLWVKVRLAPMCPWMGTLSLAFVSPPNVKVQLSPYNRLRLMRVPLLQNFLRKLLTVDLPGVMVLPERLEINIPPSVTSVAEAAVGRDTIMRAVASAVLQADAVEQALLTALPLGPQTPAGGISLPEFFCGELDVVLREARNLPVWGFPGQSNPYVRLLLGEQAMQSRKDDDTSLPGRHRHPVWHQDFQFLVEDTQGQVLELQVRDSHLTGRVEVGTCRLPLAQVVRAGGRLAMWLPLQPPLGHSGTPSVLRRGGGAAAEGQHPHGEVFVEVTYKSFDDDDEDDGRG
ncbi:hypothetical protein V8C86DRAFT_1006047 [Haematococcus lacustris]